MLFCRFTVDRNLHEDREYLSYDRFVIEAESNRGDAVLALLTERNRRRIGPAYSEKITLRGACYKVRRHFPLLSSRWFPGLGR